MQELLVDLLAIASAGNELKRKYRDIKDDQAARYFTYVLKLSHEGVIYVGSTDNVYTRLLQHITLDGTAQVVKAYGPVVRLMRLYSGCGAHDEKLVTLELMAEHGHGMVRGASYCKVEPLPLEPPEVRTYQGGSVQGRRMNRAQMDAIMEEVRGLAAGIDTVADASNNV